jgi:hypothetical protein
VLEYLKALETKVAEQRHAASSVLMPSPRDLEPTQEITRSAESRAIITPAVISTEPPLKSASLTLRLDWPTLQVRLQGPGGLDLSGLGQIDAWDEWDDSKPVKSGEDVPDEFQRLGETLASTIPQNVIDALKMFDEDMVIVLHLSQDVEALPWEWLQVNGQFLFLRNPVIRAPIGINEAARGTRAVHAQPIVCLIGDPGGDFPAARHEVETIAEAYRKHAKGFAVHCLIGENATCDAVFSILEGLWGGCDVLHFAGHAWHSNSDAFIKCHDDIIKARELQTSLSRDRTPFVFLNSHYTAFIPTGSSKLSRLLSTSHRLKRDLAPPLPYAGKGFTKAATAAGVGVYVGSIGSMSDEGAGAFGIKFHELLLHRLPAAVALFEARRAICTMMPTDLAAFYYILSGRHDFVLPAPTVPA